MLKYMTVIGKADGNYSACCPDLPGCISIGASVGDTSKRMKTAFDFISKGSRQKAWIYHHLPLLLLSF